MSRYLGEPSESSTDRRRDELAERLSHVRGRIAAACVAAGRDPAEVTLVAVTKTYPVDDIRRLIDLGAHDIGENRDQEAAAKAAAIAGAEVLVRWHFVGQLQRNKCRSVVRYADLVHSVDGVGLAVRLDEEARRHRDRPLDVLVQLSLDGDLDRGGAAIGADPADRDLDRVVEAVVAGEGLRLRGVMAVAPLTWDPESAFVRVSNLVGRVRAVASGANIVSAGMSEDLEQAIAHGATHVRIGSALLGNRPPVG